MFAVLGPAITGSFISLIGRVQDYWMVLALLLCSGVGGGAFHPQAVAIAARAGRERRRLAVSVFSSMGTLGFSLGPLMIALVVSRFGLGGTIYIIGFGILTSLLLYFFCPTEGENPAEVMTSRPHLLAGFRALSRVRIPLLILFSISASRSALYLLMNNFVPFILEKEGYGLEAIGGILTIFMLAGAMGSFAGGVIAEWSGERAVNVVSSVLIIMLFIVAIFVQGPRWILVMAIGAFVLMAAIPVNITQAQELAPGQTSTVSALLMGLAWGVGSLFVPWGGAMAGRFGYRTVLAIMAVLPLLTGLLVLALPEVKKPGVEPGLDEPRVVPATGD
jgi:FSR family fosmidomycin resistance protein-like MFS transporter